MYNLVYETWHAVRGCQKNHFEPIRPIPKHHLVHFTDPNKSTDSKVGKSIHCLREHQNINNYYSKTMVKNQTFSSYGTLKLTYSKLSNKTYQNQLEYIVI